MKLTGSPQALKPEDFVELPEATDLVAAAQELDALLEAEMPVRSDPSVAALLISIGAPSIAQRAVAQPEPVNPSQFQLDLALPLAPPPGREGPEGVMPPVQVDRKLFDNAEKLVRPGMDALARFGYSEPISDPFGVDMRSELRKIVRSS